MILKMDRRRHGRGNTAICACNLFPTDVVMSSEINLVTSFLTGPLDDVVTRGLTRPFFLTRVFWAM